MSGLSSTSSRSALHYVFVVFAVSLYGARVCPFMAGLSFAELFAVLGSVYAGAWFVRKKLYRALASDFEHRIKRQLQLDGLLPLGICLALAPIQLFYWGFPLESAGKLMAAVLGLGFFIACDLAITEQRVLADQLAERKIDIRSKSGYFPIRRQFMTFVLASLLIAIVLLLLLVLKDVAWLLSQVDVSTNKTQMMMGVIAEFGFVAAIVSGYTLLVIRGFARNMQVFLDAQHQVLTQVATGDLSVRIPVTRHDEFGQVADKTNDTLASLEKLDAELLSTRDATILGLASLAEARDNETGAHIQRTQHYVRTLAQYLQKQPSFEELTDDRIELMYKSAPLHDAGKVGIPDNILLKPGKLTDDEFTIMKTHPMIGAKAIQVAEQALGTESSFLAMAREICEFHHEKWDGSGYPHGLSGSAIPLSARLMALADVYDALICARVYKPAFSHEKSKGIILEGKGGHFDPAVVDAFLACEDEFVRIAEEFADPVKQAA